MIGPDPSLDDPKLARVMRGFLRALATPREVDFLVAHVVGDLPCDPQVREGLKFLAGVASRCRRRNLPFAATWSLVVKVKKLEVIEDPGALVFWARVRSGMQALASPDWPSGDPRYVDDRDANELGE